mmetsp:Transcript_5284/g.6361  ORF Transcript_5284/g.6361 Transcript_5284/m.6361 type:complete len:298 (+) Transcript_5284:30-923(+)
MRKPKGFRTSFHHVTGLVTVVISLVCLCALPLCTLFRGNKGCGVSLDSSIKFSLPSQNSSEASWGYPGYVSDPERLVRRWFLLGLSLFEADFGRRMLIATVCGSIIGFERRQADRPAGIRTMSLASMGACLFTICGTFAFMNGPNEWDASRISAALPSGVGFLGAGIIWKGTLPGAPRHTVRGLTTAAGVWISAACGCACGGGLYFPAIYGALLAVTILRYGPRVYLHPDIALVSDSESDDSDSDGEILHAGYGTTKKLVSDESDNLITKRRGQVGLLRKGSKLERRRSRITFDPRS